MRKKELEHSFEELKANMELNFISLAKKAEQSKEIFNKVRDAFRTHYNVLEDKVERIEKENKELCKKVDTLTALMNEYEDAFGFVNNYGKDTITWDTDNKFVSLTVLYLFDNKVCRSTIPIAIGKIDKFNVIENHFCNAILELSLNHPTSSGDNKLYYLLNKYKNTCTKIPKPACVLEKELAEQEQSAKSTSSVKKESKKK